jgi:hypothetical protein
MALFEVIDPAGGPAPPGPWEARPAPPASFSATGEAEEQAPLWRINLPADRASAWAELARAEQGLRAQEAAVAGAPARLRALAAQGGAASFGAPVGAPEARLLTIVGELRGEGGASFGTGGESDEIAGARERFGAFVAQVQDAVGNFAVVETRLAQRLVARSSVGWTGDLRSLLEAGLAAQDLALHHHSVALAMGSRAALLRTFASVMRGATIVALMVSSPVGAVTALPAAWRFVDDLLREARGA